MERFDARTSRSDGKAHASGPLRSRGHWPSWRLGETAPRIVLGFGLVLLVAGFRIADRILVQVDLTPPAAEELGPPAADPASEPLYAGQLGGDHHRFIPVTVTGYTSCPSQTDDTPDITATLQPTRPGTLALSRDLLRTFTDDAPFDFGDRVLIPGMGIYVVEDTMHPRWRLRADIWFHDTETARRWGRRQVYLTRVDADEPRLVAENWHPADAL